MPGQQAEIAGQPNGFALWSRRRAL